MLDLALYEVFANIKDDRIKWRDFRDVGVEESYYDYYYAEDELYVIHDKTFDTIEFVRAKSPKEAIQKFYNIRRAALRDKCKDCTL